MKYDTIVIGAGLAGLFTACQLAQAGQKTLLVATGIGAIALASGCVDVLGYQPTDSPQPLDDPFTKRPDFLKAWPNHPYHFLDEAIIKHSLTVFMDLVAAQNLPYQGTPERNWWLPGTAGAIRPTLLAPASMTAGSLREAGSRLIVGFKELRDFYPALICDNLNEQNLGVTATPHILEAPSPLRGKLDTTPLELATAFEQADFQEAIVAQLKGVAGRYDRIGFPAVLGLKAHQQVLASLKQRLNKPVFEMSTLPPSVPGRRLFEALKATFLGAGGRLIIGSKVLGGHLTGGEVQEIQFQTVTRPKRVQANHYILATGGIFGGGLETGYTGQVWEPIFKLPLLAENNRDLWFKPEFISSPGHPVARYGVRVNELFNPIAPTNRPVATNLYVVGSALAGTNWIHGRTGEGVALASATKVAQHLIN